MLPAPIWHENRLQGQLREGNVCEKRQMYPLPALQATDHNIAHAAVPHIHPTVTIKPSNTSRLVTSPDTRWTLKCRVFDRREKLAMGYPQLFQRLQPALPIDGPVTHLQPHAPCFAGPLTRKNTAPAPTVALSAVIPSSLYCCWCKPSPGVPSAAEAV